ncbi:PD-(D/E)XK nuclease family protein [Photobacterium damselae]|nr:PD-(D/E)XK nuclease family protein [Photobacterium damselae]
MLFTKKKPISYIVRPSLIDKLNFLLLKPLHIFSFIPQVDKLISRQMWFFKENMPFELRKAKLRFNEYKIENNEFIGRLDQGYELINGQLVIVDTKSHSKPTLADYLQLSIYRLILLDNGFNVAQYGYIRHEVGNYIYYSKMQLLSSFVVKSLITNYK